MEAFQTVSYLNLNWRFPSLQKQVYLLLFKYLPENIVLISLQRDVEGVGCASSENEHYMADESYGTSSQP